MPCHHARLPRFPTAPVSIEITGPPLPPSIIMPSSFKVGQISAERPNGDSGVLQFALEVLRQMDLRNRQQRLAVSLAFGDFA